MQIDLIKKCLELSRQAYYEKEIKDPAFVQVIDDVLFFAKQEEKTFYIAFQGSEKISNWILDFKYWKKFDKRLGVDCHIGFSELSDKIFKFLANIFLQNIYKDYEFVLTGHSLGAVLSTIVSIKLYHYGLNVANNISFAAPKFTDLAGATRLSQLEIVNKGIIKRFINDQDIVTTSPPNSIANFFSKNKKYQHLGDEIILLDNGLVSINSFEKVLKKNYSIFKSLNKEAIKEHKLENYKEKIYNLKSFEHTPHTFKIGG